MSIYITKDGQKKKVNVSATDVQLLDIDGRFQSKNLEDALKEVGSGTETNMTRIEEKVDSLLNPNLLINGDFQVWTRGTEFTSPDSTNGECANRWHWNYSIAQGSKINKVDGGLKITYLKDCTTALVYKMSFEDKKSLLGKQLTVSFELNGTKYHKSFTLNNLRESLVFANDILDSTDFEIYADYDEDSNDVVYLNPKRKQGVELIVKDVKLEIGDTVTPFDHKPYSVELENSIKYDIHGNYKPIYSNPNLLINGDFQVWQRGTRFTNVAIGTYQADRWMVVSTNGDYLATVTKVSNGLRIEQSDAGCVIRQYIEEDLYNKIKDKILTMSKSVDGIITIDKIKPTNINGKYLFEIPIGRNVTINWIKIEIGSVATPFVPRPYAEELALCQRYYQKFYVPQIAIPMDSTFDSRLPLIPDSTHIMRINNPTAIFSTNVYAHDCSSASTTWKLASKGFSFSIPREGDNSLWINRSHLMSDEDFRNTYGFPPAGTLVSYNSSEATSNRISGAVWGWLDAEIY